MRTGPMLASIDTFEFHVISRLAHPATQYGTPDPLLNPLGVKGLGEVAMVGVAPAIVNAVFHATGKPLRQLPVRIEDLLRA